MSSPDLKQNEAYEFMQLAEKSLKKFRLFNGKRKFEEAEELFTKAGNKFKICQLWSQAGAAFVRAADCHIALESKHEAAVSYVNAAQCYRKTSVPDAVSSLEHARDIYCELGRFESAARYEKDIAEMYEADQNLEESVKHYTRAGELYSGEDSKSHGNKCWLKVADFSAQLQQYDRAIELYEQVAKESVDNKLLKWSAKDYLVKATLCRFCKESGEHGNIEAAADALEHYKNIDIRLPGSREGKFLDELLKTIQDRDKDEFTNLVADFDSMSRLDQWFTAVLLKIKNNIGEEARLT